MAANKNQATNLEIGSKINSFCPVTGMPILQRPEWKDIYFGKDYRTSIRILGGNILFLQLSGYATFHDVKNSMLKVSSVVDEVFSDGRPVILIEDYSNLRGASLKARRYYIESQKNREGVLGMIFCNTSKEFKISIKLAKRLNIFKTNFEIAVNYPEAIKLAFKMLSTIGMPSDDAHINVTQKPHAAFFKDGIFHEIITCPDWNLQLDGYSLEAEVIDGKIAHTVSKGFMEEGHVEHLTKLHKSVNSLIHPFHGFKYFIFDVKELTGISMKARIPYVNFLKKLHTYRPFRMVILCDANRYLRATVNALKPVVPFNVHVVKDFDSALGLIFKDKDKGIKKPFWQKFSFYTKKSRETDRNRQYVKDLLHCLGELNWESFDFNYSKGLDTSHPFSPVLDALTLIKTDMDYLLRERDEANVELRKYQDELERRVEERTAELANANKELKNTQAKLVQSGKLASIGELSSGVAHELNQPLTVIRGNAQLIQRSLRKNNLDIDKLMEQVGPVERNTKRMMNIINHLQTFSRQSKSEFHPVDVNRVIEDSFLMVGEQLKLRNIEVEKDLGVNLPKVKGDANQLEQVFLNLITNARDAVEDCRLNIEDCRIKKEKNRGKLEIITRFGEPPNQKFQNFVEILIRDSGGGIPDNKVDKIFDPFFTTKDVGKGTGLGLSIIYGIIKDHKGKIEVAETGPGGTTFRIRLPI